MSDTKFVFLVLLISSVTVYGTLAGAIGEKRREKRSFVKPDCKEVVLQRNPVCEKKGCDEYGNPQKYMYECPEIPVICPKVVVDEMADCCPKKCVCSPSGDSDILYKPGERFTAVKYGKNLDCECDPNGIPRCVGRIQIITIPPKAPPRPPPILPTGFSSERDWPWV
ncbi:uncharacterized protein LOC111335703 [Stylophora pistillata]|uniref:Uncharacterized protein n=1 Tax=Stylophora pistillata TaxID=50429 RepID=A0A2B4RSH8_STYPI|nr:uncharacterized protein LOC111335703 [Stylophora pistillata]PFX21384.1 hypothetical protein AWC38_SpisGene14139 [Stylophora pistillata]